MQINKLPNIVRVEATTTQPTTNGKTMTNTPNITRPTTDKGIANALAQGYGAIVSWGYTNGFASTPAKIAEAFTAAGVTVAVPPLTASHAVRTGCQSFRKRVYGEDTFRAEVSHKDKESGEITITIQKLVVEGKKTNWEANETLVYDAANMVFKTTPTSDVGKYAVQCVNRRATFYTGLEFTRWVLKPLLLDNHAIKLQDIDGLYYMIEGKMPLVTSVKAACSVLGSVRFRKRSLLADAENITDMQEAASESLQDRIDETLQTLKTWETKSQIRSTSQAALYTELEAIQLEAELLASALGFAVGELTAAISTTKTRAVTMILEKDEALAGETPASDNSVDRWTELLVPEHALAITDELEIYSVSVEDAVAAGIPESTAGRGYYYRDGQIHARALRQLGYFGSVQEGEIIIQSL